MSEETREVAESFTTNPHDYIVRGNKIVRARSIEFVETLRIQQEERMPVEKAKEQFQLMMDVWDEKSLKGYFGTQEHRQEHVIHETKRYLTSGNISQRDIRLSQDIKTKKGYLEKLGLVHYEQRGKTWFMVLEKASIIPELMKSSSKSNDNFSLPLIGKDNLSRKATMEVVERDRERESTVPEREIGRVKVEAYSVCFEAYPSGSAKDGRTDDAG